MISNNSNNFSVERGIAQKMDGTHYEILGAFRFCPVCLKLCGKKKNKL